MTSNREPDLLRALRPVPGDALRAAVGRAAPDRVQVLEKLFENVDRSR